MGNDIKNNSAKFKTDPMKPWAWSIEDFVAKSVNKKKADEG